MTAMAAVALPLRQRTPEWEAAHLDGVSSSQIPIITGNRPGIVELWGIQTRRMQPPEIDPATQLMFDVGILLEDDLAELYTRETGRPVERVNRMLRSRAIPWALASLDRRSRRKGERRGIELKWAPHRRWNEGIETVPASVQDQVHWQLLVSGYDVFDVAVLEGSRFAVHEIGPDDKYQADLLYLARWFRGHVERNEPLPLETIESDRLAQRALRLLHPDVTSDIETLYAPDPVWDELAVRYQRTQLAAAQATREFEAVKSAVIALIGDAEGIRSERGGYEITRRRTREIDWLAIAEALEPSVDLIEQHTTTDWKAIAETLRPRRKLIDAHASLTGGRRIHAKFRNAPAEEPAEEESAA